MHSIHTGTHPKLAQANGIGCNSWGGMDERLEARVSQYILKIRGHNALENKQNFGVRLYKR